MRISRLSALAVMATLALAPAANAMPLDQHPSSARQQDLAHLRAGGTIAPASAAKPKVFWSYSYQQAGTATPVHHRSVPASGDSSPLVAVVISLVLITVVAAAVAVAVRTRRRSVRLAV
jgi:hypothetical protein